MATDPKNRIFNWLVVIVIVAAISWRVASERATDRVWMEAEDRAVAVWADGACFGVSWSLLRAMEEGRFDETLEREYNFVDGKDALIYEWEIQALQAVRDDQPDYWSLLVQQCGHRTLLPYELRPVGP